MHALGTGQVVDLGRQSGEWLAPHRGKAVGRNFQGSRNRGHGVSGGTIGQERQENPVSFPGIGKPSLQTPVIGRALGLVTRQSENFPFFQLTGKGRPMPFAVPLNDQGFIADQKMVEGRHRGQG